MSSAHGTQPRQTAGAAAATPSHPSDAVTDLALRNRFADLQAELRRADDSLTRVLTQWRPESVRAEELLVEFVEGRTAQALRLNALEYAARRSLCVFQSGANAVAPVPTTLSEDAGEEERSMPEGDSGADLRGEEPADDEKLPLRRDGNTVAAYRVVVDRAFLTEPAALRALDERLLLGHQVRVVDHPLTKLVVADEETAMVQVEPGRSVVLRPPLVALVTELFESVWRRSRPYLREDGDLDPTDRKLLQLMLSGLTDAATAHQLGSSPRTVQRRLRALMDVAGVSSRVQLGWYAMRNNWV
ncbi:MULTISPECIES: helix-turn-helix transcriptional regulator [unclassified Streptomyces]|uniref:helix-turn-helix transcriptional regulator n=1 Tax=unclassified Streptomyces TaxID=2593676 RepID=UPI0036F8775D